MNVPENRVIYGTHKFLPYGIGNKFSWKIQLQIGVIFVKPNPNPRISQSKNPNWNKLGTKN